MQNLTVELPYVLLDPMKIRKSYADEQGNILRVFGFGSYPCDLNGGRNFRGRDNFDAEHLTFLGGKSVSKYISEGNDDWRDKTQKLIKSRTKRLNNLGVPIFSTMTNLCPNKQDNLEEAYGYLDVLAEGMNRNGVVLANKEYAKKVIGRYGRNLVHVCSVIRHYDDPRTYASLFRQYDMVVIKPEDAVTPEGRIDEDFFRKLGDDCRNRSIVIVNHPCQRDCASVKDHYRKTSEEAKSYELHSGITGERMVCRQSEVMMLDEDGVQQLIDMGVTKFKIGRTKDPMAISNELFPSVEVFK